MPRDEIEVVLPTLHPGQVRAFDAYRRNRFTALRAGRRWGKTDFGKALACSTALRGYSVGWFAPSYKIEVEAYSEIVETLSPVKKASDKTAGVIRLITGGRIDFWSLENERAGRSRKYKLALIDEAAFAKRDTMKMIWEQSIKPTLLDEQGKAVAMSNTNGADSEQWFWQICQPGSDAGFFDFNAPTSDNPHLPLRMDGETDEEHAARRIAALDALRRDNPPLVYQQEYLAEFVDWAGAAFFGKDALLDDGRPVEWPAYCDSVFAVIDTAVKTGRDNDGTAVVYFARSKFKGVPLVVLDWDIVQIEGALLETWLPNVFRRLEELARLAHAQAGSIGCWIEDAQSGSVLLQQALRRRMMVRAIESKLTSMGKDERAISVSGYVYRGMIKFCRHAYEKVLIYKGVSRNHLWGQVLNFRIGDKDAATRADDLLDCFTYGIALSLGDAQGF